MIPGGNTRGRAEGNGRRGRQRRLTASLAIIALVAAGCTSSSSDSGERSADAYCDATADLANIETLLSPDSIRNPDQVESAFTAFGESLREIEQKSPPEIEDDLVALGEAVEDVISILATVDFDLLLLDDQTAGDLTAVFQRPAVQSASQRIEAYDVLHCAGRPSPNISAVAADEDPASSLPPDGAGINPEQAAALEYAELIRTSLTTAQIDAVLEYTVVADIGELVDALQAGDVTIDEIDLFLQRRSDGVPFSYGDDPELDILWNACGTGDWPACDGLYEGAPFDSLYQRFAETCGQALEEPAGGQCVERFDD